MRTYSKVRSFTNHSHSCRSYHWPWFEQPLEAIRFEVCTHKLSNTHMRTQRTKRQPNIKIDNMWKNIKEIDTFLWKPSSRTTYWLMKHIRVLNNEMRIALIPTIPYSLENSKLFIYFLNHHSEISLLQPKWLKFDRWPTFQM